MRRSCCAPSTATDTSHISLSNAAAPSGPNACLERLEFVCRHSQSQDSCKAMPVKAEVLPVICPGFQALQTGSAHSGMPCILHAAQHGSTCCRISLPTSQLAKHGRLLSRVRVGSSPKEDVESCLIGVTILILPCCHLATQHIPGFQKNGLVPSICQVLCCAQSSQTCGCKK